MKHTVIAITPGEPAGIGPDICLPLARERHPYTLVFIADPGMLAARARALGSSFDLPPWNPGEARPGNYLAPVAAPQPVEPGKLDPGNARYVLATLDRAIEGCMRAEFDALVTGPVHKGVLNDAGAPFTGHTEYIGERCGAEPVMMLAAPGLRVALATTHVPLAEVSRHVTRERLRSTVRTLQRDLERRFGVRDPRILVCGLNPHAGESGHLGREEIEVIRPVIAELAGAGMRLRGPVPADTAFIPAQLAEADAVLAMYHDQGLPVIKHHDFGGAVNVTLGLPFVRTSVDHGTALELAASGRADASSLRAAATLAHSLCRQ